VGIEDMNFDGNPDIRTLNWLSTNLQTTYWYWLYDETNQQFQLDTTLEEIRNPDFNPAKKTIHTWWSDGYQNSGHAIYKWKENKLQLIAEETETWGIDSNASGILITERMIDGEIKVTEREVKKRTLDYLHNGAGCGIKR
jgi:transcriptional regulator with XRE-family HTH domain